jgi:Flp pilus assembly protein TadD
LSAKGANIGKKRKGRRRGLSEGEAWRARPQRVEAWLSKAEDHIVNQAYDGAVQTARQVLRHVTEGSKPYGEANYHLGVALAMLQDFRGSREALSRALEVEPDNASAWYNRALSNRFLLRTGEALRDVERAVELEENPQSRRVYEEERAFIRDIVERQRAMRGPDYTVDQLIEEQRTFWRGVHLMEAEAWEEAESVFRHVIDLGNVPHQPWGNLGACLIMQERYDEAEEALRKALEINPDYAIARQNLMILPVIRKVGPSAMRMSDVGAGRKAKQDMLFIE